MLFLKFLKALGVYWRCFPLFIYLILLYSFRPSKSGETLTCLTPGPSKFAMLVSLVLSSTWNCSNPEGTLAGNMWCTKIVARLNNNQNSGSCVQKARKELERSAHSRHSHQQCNCQQETGILTCELVGQCSSASDPAMHCIPSHPMSFKITILPLPPFSHIIVLQAHCFVCYQILKLFQTLAHLHSIS